VFRCGMGELFASVKMVSQKSTGPLEGVRPAGRFQSRAASAAIRGENRLTRARGDENGGQQG
jgi:hypothetical protein